MTRLEDTQKNTILKGLLPNRRISEAYRIHLTYLFDPMPAVHTSMIEPLPHQLTVVYDAMLSRHPLRFLLADAPGVGKTIMAELLIKELMMRKLGYDIESKRTDDLSASLRFTGMLLFVFRSTVNKL